MNITNANHKTNTKRSRITLLNENIDANRNTTARKTSAGKCNEKEIMLAVVPLQYISICSIHTTRQFTLCHSTMEHTHTVSLMGFSYKETLSQRTS